MVSLKILRVRNASLDLDITAQAVSARILVFPLSRTRAIFHAGVCDIDKENMVEDTQGIPLLSSNISTYPNV